MDEDEPIPSYRVEHDGADPRSDAGRAVFASLFEERPDPSAIKTFPLSLAPGTHRSTHRHTAGLAATLTSGSITFVFGADGNDHVELGPGDTVWIRAGVMHDEETSAAESVEMIVAHLEPFETLEP